MNACPLAVSPVLTSRRFLTRLRRRRMPARTAAIATRPPRTIPASAPFERPESDWLSELGEFDAELDED